MGREVGEQWRLCIRLVEIKMVDSGRSSHCVCKSVINVVC